MNVIEVLVLVPVVCGSLFSLAVLATVILFRRRRSTKPASQQGLPAVSVLKPVYGLERNLERNLRSACEQDYPEFQVVFSVQHLDDPALPLLRGLQKEFGPQRVTVVAVQSEPILNGKVQNLQIALGAARHDILVISDSDVYTPADYLRHIAAPLSDPSVGYVCTLYRGVDARRWWERLELLTYNAEFIPSTIFAQVTGASGLCLGASLAVRRSTLDVVGGLESLADYLVEDYELGRRIIASGQRMKLLPYFVDLTVDLKDPVGWWRHQVYWDQNTRAARPAGFLASILTRAVPFALLYGCLRLFDPIGIGVLGAVLAVRLGAATCVALTLGDWSGLRALWLLPLRDLFGLASWFVALSRRRFVWRGHEFEFKRDGRIVARST